jgi:predicted ATPase/class 3 adenylate cyclase
MSKVETLTLLLTDLVDSTQLISELGDAAAAALMARHDRLARDLLVRFGGREIDKSDGFLFLFDEAADAVAYALAYHGELRRLSAERGRTLAARAGLHTGEVRLLQNRADDVARGAKPIEVEGIAKATAARVMTVALGGQTLLTASAAVALGPGPELVSHGHYRMKGLAEPIELFEAVAVGGEPQRPPPDSPKVYRVTWTAGGWRLAREVPNNLGPERVRFFGRQAELFALAEAFGEGASLVSLVGPGGAGKTHAATQYARAWLGDWPGGAWFCDLSEARDAIMAVSALGRCLGVPLEVGDPAETLGEALGHRGRMLLLLDNVEQIVGAVGPLLGRLMARAPQVGWLVTSRQRLDLRGERVIALDPLATPEPSAGLDLLREEPAIALFVDRALAVAPNFRLDADNAADVARLVALLDGLPLALELAAARVRVLPPRRILERMSKRFDLLRDQRGRGVARQSTLKGAIDWSWELLAPAERAALAQCAVFEGSFDLEAAEAVLELSAWPDAPMALDLVESLVDKCLLRALLQTDGEPRFALFRSIQDYAHEKLDDLSAVADPEGEPATGPAARAEAALRHARHFAAWGQPEALSALRGPDQRARRRRLAADLDNVVAASRRAAALGEGTVAAEAALGALALLQTVGPLGLAEQIAEAALSALAPGPLPGAVGLRLRVALGAVQARAGRGEAAEALLGPARAEALAQRQPLLAAQAGVALGYSALQRGALELAEQALREAIALAEAGRDRRLLAEGLTELAHVIGIRGGRFAEAEVALARALREQTAVGDLAGEALTRSYAGALASIQGDYAAGRAAYLRAYELAQELGDTRTMGLAQGMIGSLDALTGRLTEAAAALSRAIALQSSIGDQVHEAMHIHNYAQLLEMMGQRAEAARWLHRAIEIARQTGDRVSEGNCLGILGSIEAESGDLAAARRTLAEGAARLREAGDPMELAKLLCQEALVALQAGDRGAAVAAQAEVQALTAGLGVGEGSELAQRIERLAALLG